MAIPEKTKSALQFLAEGFGYMFYLVPPRRFALAAHEEAPNISQTHGTPMFFLLMFLELVGLSFSDKDRSVKYRLNDVLTGISLGINMASLSACTKPLIKSLYVYIYTHHRIANWDVKRFPTTTWLLLFLGVDMAYYWAHRLLHVFHVGWMGHSVHHSGEEYNYATALRQGIMQPFFSWITYMPLALFFPFPAYNLHYQCNILYQFWVHTELVGRLGPLEYILNTPMAHRMHHRPPGNCNYAGVLIIWDRIFGTYKAETQRLDYYGQASQPNTFVPATLNFQHYNRWRQVKILKESWMPSGFRWFFARRAKHKWLYCKLAALIKPIEPMEHGKLDWEMPKGQPKRPKYDGVELSWPRTVQALCLWLVGFVAHLKMSAATGQKNFALLTVSVVSLHLAGKLLDRGSML